MSERPQDGAVAMAHAVELDGAAAMAEAAVHDGAADATSAAARYVRWVVQ